MLFLGSEATASLWQDEHPGGKSKLASESIERGVQAARAKPPPGGNRTLTLQSMPPNNNKPGC